MTVTVVRERTAVVAVQPAAVQRVEVTGSTPTVVVVAPTPPNQVVVTPAAAATVVTAAQAGPQGSPGPQGEPGAPGLDGAVGPPGPMNLHIGADDPGMDVLPLLWVRQVGPGPQDVALILRTA